MQFHLNSRLHWNLYSAPWWFWSSLVKLTSHNLHLQLYSQASWGYLNILRKIVLETMVSEGPLWMPLYYKAYVSTEVCQLFPCLHHLPVSFGSIFYQLLDEGYSCPYCPFLGGGGVGGGYVLGFSCPGDLDLRQLVGAPQLSTVPTSTHPQRCCSPSLAPPSMNPQGCSVSRKVQGME